MRMHPLNFNLEVWFADMEPKLNKPQRTVKIEKNHQKKHVFLQYLNFIQFRLHISDPNLQVRVQWMLAHLLIPLRSLRAHQ